MFIVKNEDIEKEISENMDILNKLNALEKIINEEFFKNEYKHYKKIKRIDHMKIVTLISLKIINRSEKLKKALTYENIEDIIFGSMLHDIKKFEDYEYDNHAKLGALFVSANKNVCKLLLNDEKRIQNVARIVRNHKKGSKTKLYVKDRVIYVKDKENDKRNIEVKIVQDSDKISDIFRDKNYKDIEKIKRIKYEILSKKGLNFKESLDYLDDEIQKILISTKK